jgi:uncharacterized heparinase superfamily protein
MTANDLTRLVRTAVYLQPGQIGQRARLRAQRAALKKWPSTGRWLLAGPDRSAATGWPSTFTPLDVLLWQRWPGGAALRTGRLHLLGLTRTLAHTGGSGLSIWTGADWALSGEPLLWRFHAYYWDWAWGLVAEPERSTARDLFATLWRSWRNAVAPGRGMPWHPYPTALRAWSYCGLHRDLVKGSEIEDPFLDDLAAHLGFLRRHLERDVGGNHLIKNLKALIGLAVFFADDVVLERSHGQLARELARQVLDDGGHYERAPAYHCQVLADLIDIVDLLRRAGRYPIPELSETIRRMRRWLGEVLLPGDNVPLLNDGFPVSQELLAAVRPGPPPGGPLLVLPDTGLVRAAVGNWHLLADVGPPCPDELPAHAHADTFGCLVHVAGQPLLVDTGTSTYVAGALRSHERSTAAHNTVEVDGSNSTEVWGAFRAARRARVHDMTATCSATLVTIEAGHDGYRTLPGRPFHRRRWSLTERGLRVDDVVTGRGRHIVMVRWHLPPGAALWLASDSAIVTTPGGKFAVTVTATSLPTLSSGITQLAAGYARKVVAPVLSCRVEATLPVRISPTWQESSDRREIR